MTAAFVGRVRDRVADGSDVASAVQGEAVIADERGLAALSSELAAEISGAGPLEPLLALPGVTDVLVNGPGDVWIDRGHGLERTAVRFADDSAVRRLAQRLAAAAGQRLDDASPWVDAGLPDGTRLHAVLAPLASATTMSLRVLGRRALPLGALVDDRMAEFLRRLLDARVAFVISGGTGSGKTTLLGALLGELPPSDRVVLIEDACELVTAHPHLVRLATRVHNVEGAGAVGVRDLVRQALRMRPDRVVVGEFRGAETVDLLIALNTGHEGAAATVHANSAVDVPARLVALGLLAGLTREALAEIAAGAVRVVVHLRRNATGQRTVEEIAVIEPGLIALPAWSAVHGPGPGAVALARLLGGRAELLR